MDSKVLILLTMTIAAAMILACGPREVRAQTIGSVQLINAVGEKVTMPLCTGPGGDHRGPGYIDFPGFQYFQFGVNALSRGWRCSFEWVNSQEGGRKHTADVLVWEGLLHSASADAVSLIAVVPCVDCIWKIQRDGFYRADDKNHDSFKLMARWN